MTPIYQKSLGLDNETGLEVILKAWKLEADAKTENINVEFDVDYISPTGQVVKSVSCGYNRINMPAVLYSNGEVITEATETEPAVIAVGGEVKTPASLKFEEYRTATVGLMIAGLIKMTIDNIQSVNTIAADTKQI